MPRPPGRARLEQGPHVGATAIELLGRCREAEGRARCLSPPGRARLGPGSHLRGRPGCHAVRLVPSSGGEGATPHLVGPYGLGPGPRVWAPRPSRYSVGAEQRRGRAHRRSPPSPRRVEPGSGRGSTCVGATACTLLGWCRAAEGRAHRRSPPGEARLGPWPHVCGCHSLHATRLVPSSGGEGATPLPAGLGPARAGPPRVWVPLPSRFLVGAKQRRRECNAAPCRAEPGSGRGPTCVGAMAFTLLSWC